MATPGRALGRRVSVWLALVVLVAGCGLFDQEVPTGMGQPATATDGSVCELLAVGELEVALNTPLRGAGQPAHRSIVAGMDTCRHSAGDAAVAWGVLAEDAHATFARYADWHADYLDETEVAGHDAVWDARLDTLLVAADDRLVGVRLRVPDPPAAADDRAAYQRDRAGDLAARLVGRP